MRSSKMSLMPGSHGSSHGFWLVTQNHICQFTTVLWYTITYEIWNVLPIGFSGYNTITCYHSKIPCATVTSAVSWLQKNICNIYMNTKHFFMLPKIMIWSGKFDFLYWYVIQFYFAIPKNNYHEIKYFIRKRCAIPKRKKKRFDLDI